MDKAKDPFADAYPPGQGPPPGVDDIPIKPLGKAKDPFADAYPPGQGPPAESKDELMMDFSAPKKPKKGPPKLSTSNFNKNKKKD